MRWVLVVFEDPAIKFTGYPTDAAFVSYVGCTEPTGGHPPEECCRFDQDDRFSQSRGCNGCGDPTAGSTVNDDICIGLHSSGHRGRTHGKSHKEQRQNGENSGQGTPD
jgi:hypothetical protein